MTQWGAFVGATGVVLTLFLSLARLSQSTVREPAGSDDEPMGTANERAGSDDSEPAVATSPSSAAEPSLDDDPPNDPQSRERGSATVDVRVGDAAPAPGRASELSTGALVANVALTQGLFGAALLAAAFLTQVPASAFGVTAAPLSTGLPALAVGVGLGVVLYAANELGAATADALGLQHDERLRELLAPDTAAGWVVLLALVLPLIAGVEEFVFRAAIVGAPAAGFGTSPWALALVSAAAFALGHGAQGRLGVVVTGALGFVLAAAFVLTGSLLVVVVAHYLVNALEFVVHELLGLDWAGSAGGG